MQSSRNELPTPSNPPDRCPRLTQGARSNHVLEAAIRLFARKGFQGTKTKEIAEAAGVNEALIFRDFRSKQKLYCAILEYASSRINAERWIEELTPYAEARNDAALLSGLARRVLEAYGREPDLFRLMLYSALEQHELATRFRERQVQPVEHFIDNMRTRQKEGAFCGADAAVVARGFLNLCYHRIQQQLLFGLNPSFTDAAAAQTFTDIFLDGLRAR